MVIYSFFPLFTLHSLFLKMQAITALAFAAVAVSGKSLTAANIDTEMAGKAAFIKFQAPW